jgi:hypothetical protein
MAEIPKGLYAKSFYYNEPLVSDALSADVRMSMGQGFKLDGFRLLAVQEGNQATVTEGCTLQFSAGSFVSNGVAVEIKDSFNLDISPTLEVDQAQAGLLIYASTLNSIETSPVTVDYKQSTTEGVKLGPTEVLIGVFYPSPITGTYFVEGIADAVEEDERDIDKKHTWRWLPAPSGKISSFAGTGKDLHAHFLEVGPQWTFNLDEPTTTENLIFSIRDEITALDWAYRVDMGVPSNDDQHHLFFINGRLLRDGADYIRESPGSLIVWSKKKAGGLDNSITYTENPYFSSSNGIESTELTSGSFSSLYSENIQWRYEVAFNGEANPTIELPANYHEGMKAGLTDYLVFTNGFLLPPTRYDVDTNTGTFTLKPRVEFEADVDGNVRSWWITEEAYYNGGFGKATSINTLDQEQVISHVSIVGVTDLTGIDVINAGVEAPKHQSHGTMNNTVEDIRGSYSNTKYLGYQDSNDMQVWVNGRLSYPEHSWANVSTASFTMYDVDFATSESRQAFVSEPAVDKIKVSPTPANIIDTPLGDYYEQTLEHDIEEFNSLVSVRFASSGKQKETINITRKAYSFEELTDPPAAVGRAIFNYPYHGSPLLEEDTYAGNKDQTGNSSDPRHFNPNGLPPQEFVASNMAFNQNYFVTIDSLMGFTSDPTYTDFGYIMPGYDEESGRWPQKNKSLFATMEVHLMSDVPMNVGKAFMQAKEMHPDGLIGTDPTASPPKGPTNKTIKSSTTGRYTDKVDVETFFSDLNPISDMASIDSFLNKFAETFGFYLDRGDGTREIFRDAGVQYSEDGFNEIIKSFGGQVNANAKKLFNLTDTDSITQVMTKMYDVDIARAGYGWGLGYMWSNSFFNMEDGIVEPYEWSKSRILNDPLGQGTSPRDEVGGKRFFYGDYGGYGTPDRGSLGIWNRERIPTYNSAAYRSTNYHETRYKDFPYGNVEGGYDAGFYTGHKGFLRPDEYSDRDQQENKSNIWSGTAFSQADASGIILDPAGDHTNKCYPHKGGFTLRDGYIDTHEGATGVLEAGYLTGFTYTDNYRTNTYATQGRDGWRRVHYSLADRTYISKKGGRNNYQVHINPIGQIWAPDVLVHDLERPDDPSCWDSCDWGMLAAFILAGMGFIFAVPYIPGWLTMSEFAFYGNAVGAGFAGAGTQFDFNQDTDDIKPLGAYVCRTSSARRLTYYLEEKNGKFGLRPFGFSGSIDIKGYERGCIKFDDGNVGNYFGYANIPLQFFVSGPLKTITPTYTGGGSTKENFFTKT